MNKNLTILITIVIISVYLIYPYKYNKTIKLDKVTLKIDDKINNKNLAIMIQKEDGSGYEKTDTFPTGYVLNDILSGCIDDYGNNVLGILSYDKETKNLKLKLNGSSYCYLYFDTNLFDIETEILIQNSDGSYKSVSETPTTDAFCNYAVRYDCTDNDGIVSFGYDYTTHKYRLVSSTKNKCNIYFEKMLPDIKIILYIDEAEANEISITSSYNLNETLSTCTNSEATISYDDTTKKVKIISDKATTCNVYLEGA